MALGSLIVLAALLRLPRLGQSLWYDEVYYSTHERFGTWQELAASLDVSPAAPLYRVLLFAWVSLFGEAEIVVRLPSLLFGLGSIALACVVARARLGAELAFGVGLWLAFSPVHVWYSQEATPYALALCLALAAIWQGDRLRAAPKASAVGVAILGGLLLALALTQYFFVALLLSSAMLAAAERPPLRRRMLIAHAAAASAFGLVLWIKHLGGNIHAGLDFLRPFTLLEGWMLAFQWFLHGNSIWSFDAYRAATVGELLDRPGLLAFQVVACGIFVRGLWIALRTPGEGRDRSSVVHFAALPALFALLGVFGFERLYIERYALLSLPFFAILLFRGASRPRRRLLERAMAAWLVAMSCAAYVSWYAKPVVDTVSRPKPDWRAAVADLLAVVGEVRETELVVVTPSLAPRFYLRRALGGEIPARVHFLRFRVDQAADRGVRTIFLVWNRFWPGPYVEVLRALGSARCLERGEPIVHPGVVLIPFRLLERSSCSKTPLVPGAEERSRAQQSG